MSDPISSAYERYVSPDMQKIFSKESKYSTWRQLWAALAKSQKQLGLDITDEQIDELETNIHSIDFDRVRHFEETNKHEVMAHIQAYGEMCPKAKKIIHLGATSAYVMDNTDLIQMRAGLNLILDQLYHVLDQIKTFAKQTASLPCLSFTHLQPAQPTTVGKRLCSWLQDLIDDANQIKTVRDNLPFLGAKGATGTQSSFFILFDRNSKKVQELDESIAKAFGFSHILTINTQTYPRKIDHRVFSALCGLAVSSHKIGTDIRLLSAFGEAEERRNKGQVGSSAMPHKHNPILSERLCSLSRLLISLSDTTAYNAALQWLERSLDDSANRRIVLSQGFYLADAITHLLFSLFNKLTFSAETIEKHLTEAMPLISMEPLLMQLCQKGKDRNEMHRLLSKHAREAVLARTQNKPYDFIKKILDDPNLDLTEEEIHSLLDEEILTGRASQQVMDYLDSSVTPFLDTLSSSASMKEVSV